MSNKHDDILSIQQYLRGELDARAMHLFERATLNDPFLMDALEGYGPRADQQANLGALRDRLQTRIGYTTDEDIKPFNLRLIIMATIAVIGFALVAAWWILVHIPQEKRNAIQKSGVPEIKKEIIIAAPADTAKNDTTRKDSAAIKLDSLKKIKQVTADKGIDTVLKNNRTLVNKNGVVENYATPATSPARAAKTPVALGSTVHPSTVIADLNRLPYNKNRPKPNESVPASQISAKQVADQPPTNKPVADKPIAKPSARTAPVAKPLEENADKSITVAQSMPATSTEQLIEKNLPKTVIMSPSENSVQSTTTVVQATPPATVALTGTPTKTANQGISPIKSNAGSRTSNPEAVRGPSDSDMRGRDISSLGSAAVPEKVSKVNETTVSKPKAVDEQVGGPSATGNLSNSTSEKSANGISKKSVKRNGPPVLLDGKVISNSTGQPIAQVVIWNKTEDIQHRLEADGVFDIVAHKGDILYIGRSGFNTRKIKVTGQKKFDIILEEKNSTLYDGFLRGINFIPFDDNAHPLIGWDGLKPYQTIKSSNGKTGTVRVKFTVNADNSLTDIKVEDSVSAAADTQAVHVIRNKMKWIHNTNNQPETITVKFKVE